MTFRTTAIPVGMLIAGTLTFGAAAVAAPGDMSVATFLAKADALKAKGPLALLSPDIKLLQSEAQAAGLATRAQLEAEHKAGRPGACPPKPARISSDELLGHMRAYPAAKRSAITVKTAMADLFRSKFPCPR